MRLDQSLVCLYYGGSITQARMYEYVLHGEIGRYKLTYANVQIKIKRGFQNNAQQFYRLTYLLEI